MQEQIQIFHYTDKYKTVLQELSYEWLNKYDLLEEEDEKMLNDPTGIIIDNGGFIFMLSFDDLVIGTIALEKKSEEEFEILKYAIRSDHQGKGIGAFLMDFIIQFAKDQGIQKLMLHSNTKLETALIIYEKFGFKQSKHIDGKFEKSDLTFEMMLN